ncbi:FliH/SctL family protein [Agarivorans sp. DSG3-1]|uniref:FliH/SctL family protein n=1 Tax=Agarivorans sp. DSG3-1 TaxID=3342249 RepID=UPI00398F24B3
MASVLLDTNKIKRKQALPVPAKSESTLTSETAKKQSNEDLHSAITLKVRQEMDSYYRQQLEDAYEKGYQQCKKDNKKSNDNLVAAISEQKNKLIKTEQLLSDATNALTKAKGDLYLKAKSELLEVVFEAVGRIVCEDYLQSDNRVEFLINSILENLTLNNKVTLAFHSEDLHIIKSQYSSLIDSNPHLAMVSSQHQEIGGVTITSADGELDLRLSTKLQQFQQLLIQSSEESFNV